MLLVAIGVLAIWFPWLLPGPFVINARGVPDPAIEVRAAEVLTLLADRGQLGLPPLLLRPIPNLDSAAALMTMKGAAWTAWREGDRGG